MSTGYFLIDRQTFELNQQQRNVWYKAVNDAVEAFSKVIRDSNVIDHDWEIVGIDDIRKITQRFEGLSDLDVIYIGRTWCSSNGKKFDRHFGDISRENPEEILEDLTEIAKGDFENNIIINENLEEVSWEKFKELIFSTVQRPNE